MARRISIFLVVFVLTVGGIWQLAASSPEQGTTIELNGQPWSSPWLIKREGSKRQLFVQDTWFSQALGATLLSSESPDRQRYQWFSSPDFAATTYDRPLQHRFLQIDALKSAWRTDTTGNVLKVFTPDTTVQGVRRNATPTGERITLVLSRPTPWQLTSQGQTFTLSVSAEWNDQEALKKVISPSDRIPNLTIRQERKQLILEMRTANALIPNVSSLSNPPRIIVNLEEGFVPPARRIAWHPGVIWREEWIKLAAKDPKTPPALFHLYGLEVNPKQSGLSVRPIWASKEGMTGRATLPAMAKQAQAAAAINGGFFNRDRSLPVGPLKRDNLWFAGPVFQRGVIAWNDRGEFLLDRLTYAEKLTQNNQQRFSLTHLNSGYVQKGIARYLPTWGPYTTLTDNETIFTVQQNTVITKTTYGKAGTGRVIPPDGGYLLVARQTPEVVSQWAPQTSLEGEATTQPPAFNRFPHLLGAGPLLLKAGKPVTDAPKEGFSPAFASQKAPRSAVATLPGGKVLFVTLYGSPTLGQTTQVLQQLGAIDALNLDGGGSTGLWLGGNMLDRSVEDLRPIHNALGIFINPSTEKEAF